MILTTKKADEIFSKLIRARDPWCFFGCGRPSKQASHFWGRGNSSTRYDAENVDGVCGGCHMKHEGNKQGLYRQLKIKQLGMRGYVALERRSVMVVPREEAILKFMKSIKYNDNLLGSI
jgi:hypothetical protein